MRLFCLCLPCPNFIYFKFSLYHFGIGIYKKQIFFVYWKIRINFPFIRIFEQILFGEYKNLTNFFKEKPVKKNYCIF